mmetsp:Transcript_17310/g.30806  ORF Transcript_17310/g.30806 Transcript_17310/m.30806 type:complete len:271 (+) Transcript_17310:71-883(+)
MASVMVAQLSEALEHGTRSNSTLVQLEVQMLTGRTLLPHGSFLASTAVALIKQAVHASSGIPTRHQRLIWESNVLEDSAILGDLSLPAEGAILQVVVSLPDEEQVARVRPVMQALSAALDVVDAKDLTELKNMANPPGGVDMVLEAVMHLRAGIDPAIAVDARGRVKDCSWKASRNMIKDPKKFLAGLRELKTAAENGDIPARNFEAACRIRDAMGDAFDFEAMKQKSKAAAGLTNWVLSIIQYHRIIEIIRTEFEGFDIMAELRAQMVI